MRSVAKPRAAERFVHTLCLALRCIAVRCGERGAAPQRNASTVNTPSLFRVFDYCDAHGVNELLRRLTAY